MDDLARRDALRLAVAAGAVCVGGLGAAPALAGLPDDGAAAWLEEQWSVDPAALPQFLAAYDANLMILARRTPGYLGHTVLTAHDRRQGTRGTDWDVLFGRAYNVLVTHHIRTWADADEFRRRITALHDRAYPGISLHERLARTVFPHADNYRDAAFRTVDVGPWAKGAAGRHPRSDAGLTILVGEHWQAPAGDFAAWLSAYDSRVRDIVKDHRDYRGYRIATSLPPQEGEACGSRPSPATGRSLGIEEALYVKSRGIVGACSDVSIDVGALYNNSYNVVVMHQMRGGEVAERWLRAFSKIHGDGRNNAAFTKRWTSGPINNASVV